MFIRAKSWKDPNVHQQKHGFFVLWSPEMLHIIDHELQPHRAKNVTQKYNTDEKVSYRKPYMISFCSYFIGIETLSGREKADV